MTSTEVSRPTPPASRLHEWLQPERFSQFFAQMQPFDKQIKVEEEVVGPDLVIRAEVPGVDPDKDVEITVDDGVLTLRVERRKEETTNDDGGFRSEFSYGSFRRVLTLPKGATAKDVVATYTDGILQVKVPMPSTNETAEKVAVTRA